MSTKRMEDESQERNWLRESSYKCCQGFWINAPSSSALLPINNRKRHPSNHHFVRICFHEEIPCFVKNQQRDRKAFYRPSDALGGKKPCIRITMNRITKDSGFYHSLLHSFSTQLTSCPRNFLNGNLPCLPFSSFTGSREKFQRDF